VLRHFDTEAIYALSAPRLMLSGDQDDGIVRRFALKWTIEWAR
jgi:hypothetical protein